MNDAIRDRPLYRLTRHFFHGLFDLGFLSEDGVESFDRMIIGICTVFFSFGLLLVRVFMANYGNLRGLDTAEPYRQALVGGEAFIMALPMWIVAFVTVLVGHALFPDETDFRVLMALPVTERLIFGAKLLALALFAGLFIGAAHVALTPLFLFISMGRFAEHALPLRAAAFGVSSFAASLFAVLAVAAVNGLLVLFLPRERLMAASAALRSAMLCVLVLALPLVGRLPARASQFASGSGWLYLTPPAWFVGLEQLLLGNTRPYFVALAKLGIGGLTLALLASAGTYAVLYRHFDRVMLRPAERSGPGKRRISLWRPRWRAQGTGAYAAIRTFTGLTLRRSVLHQGVLVCVSAAGFGLVLNILTAAGLGSWMVNGGAASRGLTTAVIWAPFALIFTVGIAVRATLVLPIEQRANWVFRLTEQDGARTDQLRAAVHTVMRLGVTIPIVLLFPLQWLMLGSGAIVALIVAWLCGWLFVEVLMKDWARIPFTCSYIPAKRFVPQSMLIAFVAFIMFTTIGTGVTRLSLTGQSGSFIPNAVLAGTALVLRRRRLNRWKETPLAFEDQLPTEIHPLKLSPD